MPPVPYVLLAAAGLIILAAIIARRPGDAWGSRRWMSLYLALTAIGLVLVVIWIVSGESDREVGTEEECQVSPSTAECL